MKTDGESTSVPFYWQSGINGVNYGKNPTNTVGERQGLVTLTERCQLCDRSKL